jgi:hypothetical protein
MDRLRNCSMDSCKSAAVASLAEQNLCLDHFLSQCYGYFDCLDARRRGPRFADTDVVRTKTFVEECSRQALDVSLRCSNITNLQKGRLLDILLWAGELFIMLRTSWVCFGDSNFPKEHDGAKQIALIHSDTEPRPELKSSVWDTARTCS